MADQLCADCSMDTNAGDEFYMVSDGVWPAGVDHLCVGCLEQRLGRRLVLDDFMVCQANLTQYQSDRLRDRLAGFAEAHGAVLMDELYDQFLSMEKRCHRLMDENFELRSQLAETTRRDSRRNSE